MDKKETLKKQVKDFEVNYEEYMEWLRTTNLKNYSAKNLTLLYIQHILGNEEITEVRGFQEWKKYNRKVKKGGHAVYIYAPVLKDEEMQGAFMIPVFDISQTEVIE